MSLSKLISIDNAHVYLGSLMEFINKLFVILGESHWAVKLRQEFVNNLFIEFVLNQDQKTKLIEVVLQVCVRDPTSIPLGC